MSKEIVVIMGANAAGKTTYTKRYIDEGYHRINRDTLGGKLKELPKYIDIALAAGQTKIVLDNTYADIESRSGVIQCGQKHGIPVKCVWLDTSFEDAQFNACQRQVRKFGRLCTEQEMKGKDPNMFPPVALFGYRKRFQEPTKAEGFVEVEKVKFVREDDPTYTNKALILDYDDTLRTTGTGKFPKDLNEIKLLPGRTELLQEYKDKGYLLLGVSNQSGVAAGTVTDAKVNECFLHTNKLLGHDIDYHYCPHAAGGPAGCSCFCRKPHCGFGVLLIEKYKLDRKNSIFCGDQTTDKTFAARCGFKYFHPSEFFKNGK